MIFSSTVPIEKTTAYMLYYIHAMKMPFDSLKMNKARQERDHEYRAQGFVFIIFFVVRFN